MRRISGDTKQMDGSGTRAMAANVSDDRPRLVLSFSLVSWYGVLSPKDRNKLQTEMVRDSGLSCDAPDSCSGLPALSAPSHEEFQHLSSGCRSAVLLYRTKS